MKIITPLRFPGGKSKVIKKYLEPLFPEFDGDFFEPFVGGGSVSLWMAQKYPNKKIYINDINYNLYCFWKTLKENPESLIKELHKIRDKYNPNDEIAGKSLLNVMNDRLEYESDPYEIAIAFYVLNKISFSGLTEHGTLSKDAYKKTYNHHNINRLKDIYPLMKNFIITSEDYIKLYEQTTENDFIFLDPPYEIGEALYGKKGKIHTDFDHNRFAIETKELLCKWMITYNDNDPIRNRFIDYNIVDREYAYCMSFETDESGNKHTRKKNELIIMNY